VLTPVSLVVAAEVWLASLPVSAYESEDELVVV
jgi:hypothetical protein